MYVLDYCFLFCAQICDQEIKLEICLICCYSTPLISLQKSGVDVIEQNKQPTAAQNPPEPILPVKMQFTGMIDLSPVEVRIITLSLFDHTELSTNTIIITITCSLSVHALTEDFTFFWHDFEGGTSNHSHRTATFQSDQTIWTSESMLDKGRQIRESTQRHEYDQSCYKSTELVLVHSLICCQKREIEWLFLLNRFQCGLSLKLWSMRQ